MANFNLSKILLRRYNMVLDIESDSVRTEEEQIVSALFVKGLNIELIRYGFALYPDLRTVMVKKFSPMMVQQHARFLLTNIKEMVGAHKNHTPLFKNFPHIDETEYKNLQNQFNKFNEIKSGRELTAFSSFVDLNDVKLLSCGCFVDSTIAKELNGCPICGVANVSINVDLSSKKSKQTLKYINVGKIEDVYSLFENLINGKTSLSTQDREDITTIFSSIGVSIFSKINPNITYKETLALVYDLVYNDYLKTKNETTIQVLNLFVKNATDILRIATAKSGGDISLASKTKFVNFPRLERKFLLQLLDRCPNLPEDMKRHREKWLRLGEKLHPGDYKFSNVNGAFKMLRDYRIVTFGSKLDEYLKSKNVHNLINHLKTRPTEFLRKLDFMLRNGNEQDIDDVIKLLPSIVKSVPTQTVLLINSAITNRIDNQYLTIAPKGNIAKLKVIDEYRPHLSQDHVSKLNILVEQELIERFSSFDKLGKVFIDKQLKGLILPSNQRNATDGYGMLPRGSRFKVSDNSNVRLFLYWKESSNTNRIDIDLSSVVYNDTFDKSSDIAFYNLHETFGKHSGDWTSAPNGASEFIDINKKIMKQSGWRYLIMVVNSYSGQTFKSIIDNGGECFAGFSDVDNKNYERNSTPFIPKDVRIKVNIGANGKMFIPLAYDVETNEIIIIDYLTQSKPADTVRTNLNKSLFARYMQATVRMNVSKPNVYDLLTIHAKARGEEIVTKSDEADTVFDYQTVVANLDEISSKYV